MKQVETRKEIRKSHVKVVALAKSVDAMVIDALSILTTVEKVDQLIA
jgi:hypothetical protein